MIIGNFIADSIQGNRFDGLTPEIIKGIRLHRKIDVYTDSHPVFLSSKYRFSHDFGKYNGVLTDIIYDHFLAKNFEQYVNLPLQDYASHIYTLLQNNYMFLPEHAKRFYQYMTERNILVAYGDLKGIETVLEHLSHRIRFRYQLNQAVPIVKSQYDELEQEFMVFFKDLHSYCLSQEELKRL